MLLAGCPEQDVIEDVVPDGFGQIDTSEVEETDEVVEDVDDEVDAGGPELVCGGPPLSSSPFPAAELGVRITNPTGERGLQYPGGTVALGGVAFGDIASMQWSRGDQQGEIAPVAGFWQAAIALDTGDNTIEVTAVGSDGITTAKDSIVITRGTAQDEGLTVRVTPDHAFANEEQPVRFRITVPLSTILPDQVNLYAVDEDGEDATPLDIKKMKDDGVFDDQGGCDSAAGDREFSVTPVTCVDVIERLTQGDCLVMNQLLVAAGAAYANAGGGEDGLNQAQVALADSAAAVGVDDTGRLAGDYGLWVRFDNGGLGAVPLGVPEGFRAGEVQSHDAVLYDGMPGTSEIDAAAALFGADTCPPFDLSGPHGGASLSLAALREMEGRAVIAFAGHGGAGFDGLTDFHKRNYGWRHGGTQELWWTGEPVECGELLDHTVECESDKDCPGDSRCEVVRGEGNGQCVSQTMADALRGRIVMGPQRWAILAGFVDHHVQTLPGSVVYAGSCFSLYSASMAMAFMGAGAGAYVGFDGLVSDGFATEVGERLFEGLVTDLETVGDATCFATDPEMPTTFVRMGGSAGVNLNNPGIINGDFEQDGFLGWAHKDDARQVTSLCGASAPDGKRMALIGTGIGYIGLQGSISQQFCIPAGSTTLSFTWRYYSAEIPVSCGSGVFEDTWKITLTKPDGTETEVRDCTISDMCKWDEDAGVSACLPSPCSPPSTCGCGDCYDADNPPVDVDGCAFDGQAVRATGFAVEHFNVSSFAGTGPVRLTIALKNAGAPTLDTAVLIDAISVQ